MNYAINNIFETSELVFQDSKVFKHLFTWCYWLSPHNTSLWDRVIDRRGFLRIALSGRIWKFECTQVSLNGYKIHVFVTEAIPRPL